MARIAITLAVPDKTGASRMVRHFTDAIRDAGHDVKIIHGTPAKDSAGNYDSILDEWAPGEIETEFIRSLRRPIPPAVYRATCRAASDCDAIIGVNQRDRAVALRTASMLNVPGILAVQNHHKFRGSSFLSSIKRRYYGGIIRRFGHVFVCTSDIVRRELVNDFGVSETRCAVVHNGIQLPEKPSTSAEERADLRKRLELDPEEIIFTNIGRLDTQKAQDVLLRAWAQATARRQNCRLLLVGDINKGNQIQASRQFKASLIDFVEKHDLGNSVRFLGWRDDVIDLLAQTDIYLHSARWEGPAAPLAVIEAMAMGLPIIMTDCSGYPPGFEDDVHGFVVPNEDHNALARAVDTLAPKPAGQLREMGMNCRRLCEKHFDVNAIGKQFVRIVEAAIANRDQDFRRFSI